MTIRDTPMSAAMAAHRVAAPANVSTTAAVDHLGSRAAQMLPKADAERP